jgi:hypothetical protein
MPSRRRSRNKNIGNNLAEVSRRLRTLERKPVRTKLGNRIVKTSSLAPNAVGPDEVNFGTAVITTDPTVDNTYVENPKDGLFVVSSTTGATSVYSEEDDNFYPLADPTAQADAANAAADAADAKDAAETAQLSANGKNAVFRQSTTPTATKIGDIWFDSNAISGDSSGNRPRRWTGTEWEYFGLSYAAITSIDADKIVTGTLTGRNIQTSDSGNRIIMTNTDELQFFNNANERVGTIGPFDFGGTQEGLLLFGGSTFFDNPGVYMNKGFGGSNVGQLGLFGNGAAASPSINLTGSDDDSLQYVFIIGGGQSATDGSITLLAGQQGISLRSYTGSDGGEIGFYLEPEGSAFLLSETFTIASAVLALGDNFVQQGTGAPPASSAVATGQILFRYT